MSKDLIIYESSLICTINSTSKPLFLQSGKHYYSNILLPAGGREYAINLRLLIDCIASAFNSANVNCIYNFEQRFLKLCLIYKR